MTDAELVVMLRERHDQVEVVVWLLEEAASRLEESVSRLLLWALAPDDPISRSTEGLDDACFFCRADSVWVTAERPQPHEDNCSWFRARTHLGLSTEGHALIEKGS